MTTWSVGKATVGRRKKDSKCNLYISTALGEWVSLSEGRPTSTKRDSSVGEKKDETPWRKQRIARELVTQGDKHVWYSQQNTLLVFDFYLTPFSCSPCRAGTRVAPRNGFRFGNRITFICSSAAQYGPPSETISTGDSTLKQGERFGRLLQMYQGKTDGFLAIHWMLWNLNF